MTGSLTTQIYQTVRGGALASLKVISSTGNRSKAVQIKKTPVQAMNPPYSRGDVKNEQRSGTSQVKAVSRND
jgi:hypothetical protein